MPLFRPSVDVRPVTEFRAHTSAVLEQIQSTKRPLVLTQPGRSAAVVLAVDVYEQLIDEVILAREVRAAEAEIDAGMGIPHEAVERTLRERHLK